MRSKGGRECRTADRFALGRTATVGRFMSDGDKTPLAGAQGQSPNRATKYPDE